jgi:hypothetical protein
VVSAWDHDTRSLRLRLVEDERREETRAKVAAYLDNHPEASANEVFNALGGNRAEVLEAVAHRALWYHRVPPGQRRPRRWYRRRPAFIPKECGGRVPPGFGVVPGNPEPAG